MCLTETGSTLDDFTDDARLWLAHVWRWAIEHAGHMAHAHAVDEKFRWGGPNVPLVETFGINDEAVAAAQAYEALMPPAVRVDDPDVE